MRISLIFVALLTICCTQTESDPGAIQSDASETDTETPPSLPPLSTPVFPVLPNLCEAGVPADTIEWPMETSRISVSVFHFNIQYVAGGLDDFFGWTASEEEIEDRIIQESFAPLIDLFERHPDWGASFEMQGLMLEIMAERHPELLQRLHALAQRGQVDVMSFHYSDQLVTAYPLQDMLWSWEENQRVFEALCMPRAEVHFLQEGQFGPGIAAFLADKGEMLVLPRNLLKLFHDPNPTGWIHENDGIRVLVTNGFNDDELSLNWNYADDGELIATGNMNPYLLDTFFHDPAYLKAEYEDKLQALADDGWTIAPISHYLKVLDERDLPATPIEPPVLDGSWQPKGSANMHLWMGGAGQLPGDERDNEVLIGNIHTRQRLANLEWLLNEAETQGIDVQEARPVFRAAVRELLLAEVSDSTGWRPVGTEVAYSLNHAAKAGAHTQELVDWLLPQLGEETLLWVDAQNQSLTPPKEVSLQPLEAAPASLSDVTVTTARPYTITWQQSSDDPVFYELTLTLPATDNVTQGTESPEPVTLSVPLAHDTIAYTPALQDERVLRVPLSAYTFLTSDVHTLGLPLPNGLLEIDVDMTLVLDQSSLHLAAQIEADRVLFVDQTLPEHIASTWRVRFYPEPAEATLPHANRLNVHPPTLFKPSEH